MARTKGAKNKPKIQPSQPVSDLKVKLPKVKDKADTVGENSNKVIIDNTQSDTQADNISGATPYQAPEKIDKSILKNLPDAETKSKKGKPSKSDDEKYDHCERCHCIIKYQPYTADTNAVTGKSDVHRNVPRIVKLCSECANKLSKVVDDFLYDNGNGVKPKPYSSYAMQDLKRKEEAEKRKEKLSELNLIDEEDL